MSHIAIWEKEALGRGAKVTTFQAVFENNEANCMVATRERVIGDEVRELRGHQYCRV